MSHCQCDGIERCFGTERVAQELANYRKRGAAKTTRLLIETLQTEPLEGLTLLDIGGGGGAIAHALLPAGVSHALDVDASTAYLSAAREEAERRGLSERMSFAHGNFIEVAPTIPTADLVTLDRVICCFDDMPALVGLSAARAKRLYGLVYPRDTWWMRLFNRARTVLSGMMRTPMRFYVHSAAAVDAAVRAQGLERQTSRKAGVWQVILYAQSTPFEV
ncbi:MAG TPA: methyltransferase domain-containing protein [Ktedonobacterales bacterium]|jgi:magnesium-protoporphyrin O-methyltransferase